MRDIEKFNCTILGKWRWNLFHHEGELWVKVLDSKHESWRSLDESRSNTSDSIWGWELRHVCNASGEGRFFRGVIEWKIGCGAMVKLWEDGWLTGGKSLADKYPRLYSISQQQQNSIQQMGIASAGGWEWHLEWRRLFREVEVDRVAKFMEDIQIVTVQVDQRDRRGWRLDPCGDYTVGSAYKVLASQLLEDNFDEIK